MEIIEWLWWEKKEEIILKDGETRYIIFNIFLFISFLSTLYFFFNQTPLIYTLVVIYFYSTNIFSSNPFFSFTKQDIKVPF